MLESDLGALLLEFREIDQRIRMDRESRMLESVRMLVRVSCNAQRRSSDNAFI